MKTKSSSSLNFLTCFSWYVKKLSIFLDLKCDKMGYALNINEYQRHIIIFSYLLPCANYSKINGLHNQHLLSNCFHESGIQEGPSLGVLESGSLLKGIIWRFDWDQRICSQDDLTHMICWQEASVADYMGFCIWLLECSHNKAADFPQKVTWDKRVQDRSQLLLFFFCCYIHIS